MFMSKQVEVTITFDDKRITILGPEDFIRSEIDRLTRTEAGTRQLPTGFDQHVEKTAADQSPTRLTERALVEEKKPRGHNETVAVLAYVLTRNGQTEFTADDIRRAYIRAGVRPPKVTAQALRDSKNTADFLEAGSVRGTFRLSPHGENGVLFGFRRRAGRKAANGE